MSRGHGKTQRLLLDLLERQPMVMLRGETRSESVSLARAARRLEREGRCVVVSLWDDEHRHAVPFACRKGLLVKGKPIESLSVARVPNGTRTTLTGSYRQIAMQLGCGKSTVARTLRRVADSAK